MFKKENFVAYNSCFGGFSLSKQAINYLKSLGLDYNNNVLRHDPRLIQTIRELGDAANGSFAKLKIATIYGNKYIIEEYDGRESVVVPKDIEWINIKKINIEFKILEGCPCSNECCTKPKTYTPRHACAEDVCEECFVTKCRNCGKECSCDL